MSEQPLPPLFTRRAMASKSLSLTNSRCKEVLTPHVHIVRLFPLGGAHKRNAPKVFPPGLEPRAFTMGTDLSIAIYWCTLTTHSRPAIDLKFDERKGNVVGLRLRGSKQLYVGSISRGGIFSHCVARSKGKGPTLPQLDESSSQYVVRNATGSFVHRRRGSPFRRSLDDAWPIKP